MAGDDWLHSSLAKFCGKPGCGDRSAVWVFNTATGQVHGQFAGPRHWILSLNGHYLRRILTHLSVRRSLKPWL